MGGNKEYRSDRESTNRKTDIPIYRNATFLITKNSHCYLPFTPEFIHSPGILAMGPHVVAVSADQDIGGCEGLIAGKGSLSLSFVCWGFLFTFLSLCSKNSSIILSSVLSFPNERQRSRARRGRFVVGLVLCQPNHVYPC